MDKVDYVNYGAICPEHRLEPIFEDVDLDPYLSGGTSENLGAQEPALSLFPNFDLPMPDPTPLPTSEDVAYALRVIETVFSTCNFPGHAFPAVRDLIGTLSLNVQAPVMSGM